MYRAQLQEHLAQADRHMAELKAHIVRQRLILGRTLAECRRLLVAKSTLQALEGNLHKFGEHCELILDQLKRPPLSKGIIRAPRPAAGYDGPGLITRLAGWR